MPKCLHCAECSFTWAIAECVCLQSHRVTRKFCVLLSWEKSHEGIIVERNVCASLYCVCNTVAAFPLCFWFLYSREVQCLNDNTLKKFFFYFYCRASRRFILFWEWCTHTITIVEYFLVVVHQHVFTCVGIFSHVTPPTLCSKGGGLHFCVVRLVGHCLQRLLLYRERSFPLKPFFSFVLHIWFQQTLV